MIVLDTNVVSEPLKPAPDHSVLRWLDAQEPRTLYLTTITVAELLSGVETLPRGRRRTALERAMQTEVLPLFQDRILSLDLAAAHIFAATHAQAQAQGNPISFADCAIAAIARTHGHILATRNVRDFRGTGVALIDPWAQP